MEELVKTKLEDILESFKKCIELPVEMEKTVRQGQHVFQELGSTLCFSTCLTCYSFPAATRVRVRVR
jgi:hypothetical protein